MTQLNMFFPSDQQSNIASSIKKKKHSTKFPILKAEIASSRSLLYCSVFLCTKLKIIIIIIFYPKRCYIL